MFVAPPNTSNIKTTSYKVVLPFYVYAAISFIAAAVLLFLSSSDFLNHYFHPHILAITHIMALGWGTMIVLGASHQLVPVLIEGRLFSNTLAYLSFAFAATGIPLLVYGFYFFNMGIPAQTGGIFTVLAFLVYLTNMGVSILRSKSESVHAIFIFTAMIWLLLTALLGLTLLYNFTHSIMDQDSLHYLPLHAHIGVVGWFLLLVIGVASRLIPMFLISKYTNARLLWWIYVLINSALVLYIIIFRASLTDKVVLIPGGLLFTAICLFIYYCYQSYKQRIRKMVDDQMKLSLLSVFMLLLPVVMFFILVIALIITAGGTARLALLYGFIIFFGWITAIILGMTFKTLPFIVWNKVYHNRSASRQTPNPKDLFNHFVFKIMSITYLVGFGLFSFGILASDIVSLNTGSVLLIFAAILYNGNVLKIISHKESTS